jgi:CBS domain-containing protein
MVFAKDFLNVSVTSSSKLKNYVVKTPVLNPTDNIKRSTQLIVTTGNRALPVLEDSRLIGIISETDVILKTHFGNTLVDSVMADAIVIEDDTPLDTALATLDTVIVKWPLCKQNLCLDKGYGFSEIERKVIKMKYISHISHRGEEKGLIKIRHSARRWVVERTNSWHNRFRKLLVRYEKK